MTILEVAVPGEWDEALRLLRPSFDAADIAAQKAMGREAWLAGIAAASHQYAQPISDAVTYFLDVVTQYRSDIVEAIRAGERRPSIETARGYVHTGAHEARDVYWRFGISPAEWPGKIAGDHFVVHTNGRWYFGHENDVGDYRAVPPTTVYGFDHNMQWVPSSFPPVEAGTVVTIVQMNLLALIHYYGLPLPS